MEIDFIVSGDRDIAARLDRLSDDLRKRLVERIGGLTQQLLARVQAREPTRTGRLRAETRAFVDDGADFVRGRVRVVATGIRYEHGKVGALEYGAHRPVKVRSHERAGHTPFGRAVEQVVGAYTRKADIMAHRFLRGPVEAMRGDIRAELGRVVQESRG